MKQSSKLLLLKVLMSAKLLSVILILLFPQALFKLLYPFGVFSPFLLAAIAYAEIPKWLLLLTLIIVVASGLYFVLIDVYIIAKNRFIAKALPILIFFFLLEALSFLLSLFSSLSFGKCIGLLFNIIILCLLWKAKVSTNRGREDASDVS